MNAIKDAIKSGGTVVGTTVTPNVDVSILADAGYDFLLFDTQHSAWEIKQLQPSIQAMRGKPAAVQTWPGRSAIAQECRIRLPRSLSTRRARAASSPWSWGFRRSCSAMRTACWPGERSR